MNGGDENALLWLENAQWATPEVFICKTVNKGYTNC
jgi:hypothetical protein